MKTLMRGSQGPQVSTLQITLTRAFSQGNRVTRRIVADGIFGSQTEAAVRTFQARNNLTVDGIVGPKTWSVLLRWGQTDTIRRQHRNRPRARRQPQREKDNQTADTSTSLSAHLDPLSMENSNGSSGVDVIFNRSITPKVASTYLWSSGYSPPAMVLQPIESTDERMLNDAARHHTGASLSPDTYKVRYRRYRLWISTFTAGSEVHRGSYRISEVTFARHCTNMLHNQSDFPIGYLVLFKLR